MQIVRTTDALKAAVAAMRGAGDTVALVPTMGALHAGHLALVAEARRRVDRTIASIFVNPKQFGANEDLSRYPRREEADSAMLEEAGCDLLWLPGVEDIYPPGFATSVSVRGVADRWEGEARPGHFDGVATVVARLLLLVGPNLAVFGEKDFQQLAVIRRMAADLSIDTEIVAQPTIRDADGLALSSRNAYLTAAERQRALALPRALEKARARIADGASIAEALEEAEAALAVAGFDPIDYFALVDSDTLEPADQPRDGLRLIAAATIGSTRLIDNLPVLASPLR